MMNNTTVAGVQAPVNSTEWKVRLTFYVILIVFGLCGNFLVLFVVARKKYQRTAHHIFIMNLAVSDLCFILLYFPLYFRRVFSLFRPTVAFCKIVWVALNQTYFSSILTVTSMAVIRCYAITNPYKPQMTQKAAFVWVLAIWLLSYLGTTPAVALGTVHPIYGKCYVAWTSMTMEKTFFLVFFTFQYALPLLITSAAYIIIGVDISRTGQGGRNLAGRSGNERSQHKHRLAENMRVIKSLAIIVIFFAVLMFPKHIARFLIYFWMKTPEQRIICSTLLQVADICLILHSCLDPFVYGTVLKNFSHDFINHLKYVFCCCRLGLSRSRRVDSVPTENGDEVNSPSRRETFQLSSYTVSTSIHHTDTENHPTT